VVPSYGGGICQVSTTLYNAVIYAELDVLERYPHSMAVDYVQPSRDAAIAGGSLDFRFENPYDTPVYIFGEIDDSNLLRVVIYGKETRPENREIDFESETLSTEEYGITYQADSELAFGQTEYSGSPHTGREARLWKIVYEDGVEVSKDIFNTSTYQKSDQIIKVGTSGGSDTAVSNLKTAIATQDWEQISAAINAGYQE
jgi:vancomycin resistance protein YoaR